MLQYLCKNTPVVNPSAMIHLPSPFYSRSAELYLDTRHPEALMESFEWQDTPQGFNHWENIYEGREDLTDDDISQIRSWIVLSRAAKNRLVSAA